MTSHLLSFDSFNMLPTNSPSPVSEDSFPEHDLLHFEGDDSGSQDASGKRKTKRPPSTAERRATHNAVERARRESLNGRFMDLAGVLPNMATVKRPSKSIIVAKSLEFVQSAQAREQYLLNQNDSLRQEVNELRARLGLPALTSSPASNAPPTLPTSRTRKTSSSAASMSPSVSTSENASPAVSTVGLVQQPSLEAPAAHSPIGYTFNPAFASAFSDPVTQMQMAASAQQVAQALASSPVASQSPISSAPASKPSTPPASYPQVVGLDVNYLMALSLQQQQQNMLQLQNMPPSYTAVAPWLMPQAQMPLAAGGENQWLYS